MLWLIDQVWVWTVMSALAGAAVTALVSIKTVAVRRWVESPVELAVPLPPESAGPRVEPSTGSEPVVEAPSVSPFPGLHGSVRSREDEETPSRRPPHAARLGADAWDDAAEHWREWAGATTAAADEQPTTGTEPIPTVEAVAVVEEDEPFLSPAAREEVAPAAPVEAGSRFAPLPEPDPAEYSRRVAERLEAERLEAERLEAERLEAERVEAERLEAERREAERLARAEAEHRRMVAEAQRQEEARTAAERAAEMRLALEREQARRLVDERLEPESVTAVQPAPDQDPFATLREEQARREALRAEEIRLAAERAEEERIAAAHAEHERITAETQRREAERVAEVLAEEEAEAQRDRADRERLEFRPPPLVPARPRHAATPTVAWGVPEPAPEPRQGMPAEPQPGPYGDGSANPLPDGSAPKGFPIKGNARMMLFHTKSSRYYTRTHADVWFASEEAAGAAGFMRWDRRSTAAHEVLRNSGPVNPSDDA